MANLTEREQTLYECIAKGDFVNAQNVLKGLLEMPKYGSDPKAKEILRMLEEGSVSRAQDVLQRYVNLCGSLSRDAARLIERSEELGQWGQMSIPENVYRFIGIETPETLSGELHFTRDGERRLADEIAKTAESAPHLARCGIRHPCTVLLSGSPGTGKTMFARRLAQRMGIPLVSVKTPSLVSCRLGETGRTIASIFEFVSRTRCVFFIDEIDAFGARRGMDREIAEMGRVTIALMQMIDTLPPGFILLAATNRADILDEALMRRFTLRIDVPLLTRDEAASFISQRMGAVHPDKVSREDILAALPPRGGYAAGLLANLVDKAMALSWPDPPDIIQTLSSIA